MDAPRHRMPNDVATLQALVVEQQSTIEQLQRLKQGLEHRLDLALRRIYGRLSERIDPGQLLLFGQTMQQAALLPPEPPESPESPESSEAEAREIDDSRSHGGKSKKGHGRRPLPADLPRHRVEHALAAEVLTCPCCDEPRVKIGEEISEQLDYTPASLFVIQHVRPKYAGRKCEEGGVATAERAAAFRGVIDKGLPGPGLVAQVITSKYADHAPLYRQESMLARHGVDIARSTMCGWMKAAADLLAPLVLLMATRIRASKVIHTDDTPVPVQSPGEGRTRTGRLWVYLGDATSGGYIVYDYTPTRSRDGPAAWLSNFHGYLQADAFGGYDGIYATGHVTEVACWAHARRKFYDARPSDPVRASHALAMIGLLYGVEKKAKGLDADAQLALRRTHSAPVLKNFNAWMQDQLTAVLPKSPVGQVIAYARSNWDALCRYATDDAGGYLAIDNNAAE